MSYSRDEINPLRPYYKPPSIGIHQDTPATTSSAAGLGAKNGSASSYASSARDIFSDIDYSEYLSDSSPSAFESTRRQVDEWFYRYLSVMLSQPFDVAKTVLQVRSQGKEDGTKAVDEVRRQASHHNPQYAEHPSDDSDPDEPAYFTSAAPSATSYSPSSSRRRRASSRDDSPTPIKASAPPAHQLVLKKPDSILEVISQEWAKESGWGVWKASNTTFVYGVLLQSLEKWARGLFSALLNVPLTVGLEGSGELVASPYPYASLAVSIAAAAAAGVILAPLDLIRTKLILTCTSNPRRSLTSQLGTLTSYICSPSLLLPTILHSMITPTVTHATPLLLRSHLSVDSILTPSSFQMASFLSRTAELFIKLPLETVLRRGQMAVLQNEVELMRSSGTWTGDLDTIVKVGEYRGVLGTMWMIVREEGVSETQMSKVQGKLVHSKQIDRKGQGMQGLWRGWRVGMWGLLGMWGARALNGGSGGNAGEF